MVMVGGMPMSSQLEIGVQTFSDKHWINCERFDFRAALKVSQLWSEQLDTATVSQKQPKLESAPGG